LPCLADKWFSVGYERLSGGFLREKNHFFRPFSMKEGARSAGGQGFEQIRQSPMIEIE
jgi:hypothetical protein